MHPFLVAELIILVSVANAAPVIGKQALGNRFLAPIDAGLRFLDGRPFFGPAKTIRGAVISVMLTTIAAPVVRLDLATGALIGAMAMAGDLFSSFVKRRLDLAPSSRATGLDQIPEALFPLLACRGILPLTVIDILVGSGTFVAGAILLSPLFRRLGIRDQPF